MTFFGVKACFQVFDWWLMQWSYALGIIYTQLMLLVSLVKTFTTEPGNVTSALVEKLKNQLLLPR